MAEVFSFRDLFVLVRYAMGLISLSLIKKTFTGPLPAAHRPTVAAAAAARRRLRAAVAAPTGNENAQLT